ncbi:tyrosine-type DNA invertase [Escherichia coli]|jgi:type 1 fimbriae regulatory protein FimB|uniref:tyrosine-type DNA invertase n=1 Tax=Escherichia coli TaxID=562 RepID=UPI0002A3DD87|nr:tyrosine-type DNA invertase [Escherichia coli]EII0043451.1 tyrosine-type recombinase/integrase [Salmonella enterica]EIM4450319.1 tyrosine-type recombinase/integrase [Salmonella enterica subsp. enterica serovar Infantis]HBN3987681.1 tyrosine-type recombinase/integrase [Escherichia coli O25b:H4-ST131]EES1964795.1 tyrosine-type recombinase/integrase [Escherichia coli]EEW4742169.1 tyrosine-type recombinase/integrase [Escherichia coli]
MKQRKYLTQSEVELLLAEAGRSSTPERDSCLLYLSFIHGFRVSEVCSLRLNDVSLRDRSLHIRRMKNGFSTIHPIQRDEVRILKSWLKVRSSFPGAESEWLFVSRQGAGLTRQRAWQVIKCLGERAGIEVSLHPHMLRHACGFALADRGVDTRLIQDYLGHRNIRHTVIYTASNVERFRNIWSKKNL